MTTAFKSLCEDKRKVGLTYAWKRFHKEESEDETRIRNSIYPSLLFPANAVIRAGDLQLQVQSVNDKKDTVTLKLVGVFVKPTKEDASEEQIIIVPEKPRFNGT